MRKGKGVKNVAGETSGFLVVFFSLLALINFSFKGVCLTKGG